ncbi:DUF2059 domain-containing protein [Marinobacter zhanjiangensis]|uniref:DUF2059 domain-containing protein n=1 Tax=Marinobacter zhanjiangensis TaxID=578215 RepID=A0ABQ3B312_9GAMM|nr:DUF2059 domain-containing protein [Marinobacter zhanjiangensis]GGY75171.1 hypothetical protein GCM10007071_22990 [Marinobacter zhanjiangensis]
MRQSHSRVAALALIAGLLLSLLASAAQASPLAESVVRLSPLGAIADRSRAMLKAGIRDGLAGTGQVDPFVAETIAGIGSRAFDPRQIRSRLAADLSEDLDTSQLEAVQAWYQSDLGQRIAGAEADAASPADWEAVRAAAPSLRQQFNGTPREQLFERYNRATQATDTAVETAMAVQLELADSLAALSKDESVESVRARIEDNRPAIEGQIREQVYLTFLSMYEPFSDRDLDAYLGFLESTDGKAYTTSAGDAIHDAIMGPVSSVGNQLVRMLEPR